MPRRRALRPGSRGEEVIGALLGFLFGYMAAEGVLGSYIHPLHWLVAAVIAGVGYIGTVLWYRWRRPRRVSPARGQKRKQVRFWRRWRLPGR